MGVMPPRALCVRPVFGHAPMLRGNQMLTLLHAAVEPVEHHLQAGHRRRIGREVDGLGGDMPDAVRVIVDPSRSTPRSRTVTVATALFWSWLSPNQLVTHPV